VFIVGKQPLRSLAPPSEARNRVVATRRASRSRWFADEGDMCKQGSFPQREGIDIFLPPGRWGCRRRFPNDGRDLDWDHDLVRFEGVLDWQGVGLMMDIIM
jgi:hypothetical protein